jgi:starch-binding outer membrane protein, SusD/RagB family
MMMKTFYRFGGTLLVCYMSIGCTKSSFLSAKPDASLVVPSTISDFQAILNNNVYINGETSYGITPALGEAGSDDYYITDTTFASKLSQIQRNEYIWASDPYPGSDVDDWDNTYVCILYTNIVLDGLAKLTPSPSEQQAWNNAEGSALFIRSNQFYQLAQVFAKQYDSITATTDLGIPLRLTSDLNEKITRASVQQTYDQIINDVKKSLTLLPTTVPYPTSPSLSAGYALLARVFLTIGDYSTSLAYSDSCLTYSNTLMDYNSLPTSSLTPFPLFNAEVLYDCGAVTANSPAYPLYSFADSTLYSSYNANDLRKQLFFNNLFGGFTFLGTYNQSFAASFSGIATDEIYLIRAECYARQGNTSGAMADLNNLLIKRWLTGTFLPYSAPTADSALRLVLNERRKELVGRGLRWVDLRRLNHAGANITLTRIVHGQTYTLAPNDLRYAWPIPDNVLSFNPGMQQNPR